ncbi:MAG: hypothetical protein HY562_12440 [Ignavibacteriales bacterium]|nr:hypothetical protein [Ignavibacteriales bacterium]
MKNMALVAALSILLSPSVRSQISVIGELSQDREVRPGEKYDGVILVKNDTNEPQEVKVYQTDYSFHHSGTNNYAEAGSTPRSNAKWVAFSPSFLTVPPQSALAVNYSVTVPEDKGKKLTGTYWSMLMIEGVPKGSPESSASAKDKTQMGIMQTIRYGVQIATHIVGTGVRKLNFIDAPKIVTSADGKRKLQIDIENVGEIGMRPEVYVELFDEKGVSKGKFHGVQYRIYPGTSVRQSIDFTSVSSGTYKALVVLDAGGDDVFGAQYTLKF